MNLRDARRLLDEAQETIEAIRSGTVDAIVVNGKAGDQIYTLQGAERPYRTLVETMSEGACTVGIEGYVLYSNNSFAQMVNRPLDAVIGRPITEFIDPAHAERFRAYFAKAVSGAAADEFPLAAAKRPPVPAHFSSAIVEMDGDKDICFIITDLTGYKKTQEELRRKDEELKEKARQDREIQTLLLLTSGIAHEIRNPLHAILSITEALIQDLGDKPPFPEYKKHILMQSNRLNELLSDLMEFNKPVRRSQFAPILLADMLRKTVDEWNASGKGTQPVRFVEEPGAGAVTILGERDTLQQVVVHLLENASQHSPPESGIRLRLFPPRKGSVSFSVIDRGSGIKPELLDRIFEPFFTTRKSGTGLGLSIVRHILGLHGGSICVKNNERGDPGVTVCITLSAAKS